MPAAIEAVGNGSYLYRWDINEKTMSGYEDLALWECYEVTVWGAPTQDSVTLKVINAMWGDGVEQKLLNDYQAAQLGLLDQSYADAYVTFLTERKALKARITEDLTAWESAT